MEKYTFMPRGMAEFNDGKSFFDHLLIKAVTRMSAEQQEKHWAAWGAVKGGDPHQLQVQIDGNDVPMTVAFQALYDALDEIVAYRAEELVRQHFDKLQDKIEQISSLLDESRDEIRDVLSENK